MPPLDPAGRRAVGAHPRRRAPSGQLIAWLGIALDGAHRRCRRRSRLLHAAALGRRVVGQRALATDLRADYLRVAAQRARAHLDARLQTKVVTVGDPGLSPASLDVIFLAQVDHAFADRRQMMALVVPAALAPKG